MSITLEEALRQRDMLAEAITKAAIDSGLYRRDIGALSGPQLLMACDDLAQCIKPDTAGGGNVRSERHLAALEDFANRHGKSDDAEGLLEFYARTHYACSRDDALAARQPVGFDFLAHLQRQREWSVRTFGPGDRAAGVVDHIRKELREIESDPGDLAEWIDVAILALDGAWRSGASAEQIIASLVAKQTRNEGRTWPDWRTADPTKAIEHDRSGEAPPAPAAAAVLVDWPREWKFAISKAIETLDFEAEHRAGGGFDAEAASMRRAMGILQRMLATRPQPAAQIPEPVYGVAGGDA